MFKTMIRMWILIGIVMVALIGASVMLDMFVKAVESNFNLVAIISLGIVTIGLFASIWQVMNDKNNS